MPADGTLRLDLVDVYGEHVAQRVRVFMRHQMLRDASRLYRDLDASKQIAISGLYSVPQGHYAMEVDAPAYHTVAIFIDVLSGDRSSRRVTLPVDAARVAGVQFPAYEALSDYARRLLEASSQVLGFAGRSGKQLYDSLDDIRRAGLLNIMAKAERTMFSNGENVLFHLLVLTEIRGDRLFAEVSPDLPIHTENSVTERLFHSADETLHKPDAGFDNAGSYKTWDRYGNLQLSFFRNAAGKCRVDADIDDAQGVEHVFQVVRNALTQEPTHPFNIHELLIAHQQIDPGYKLLVHEAVTAAAAHVG